MLSLDMLLVHDPPQSPQLMITRGDKKAPCNPKVAETDQRKGGKGGPANGGGLEGNCVNVMSAMNTLSEGMYVCVCVVHANSSLGSCVHCSAPL